MTHAVIQMLSAGTFQCVVLWHGLYLCEEWNTFLGLLLANCKVALVLQLHILYVFIFQKVIVMTPLVSLAPYLTSHFSAVYVKLSRAISFYHVTLLFSWWKQEPFLENSDVLKCCICWSDAFCKVGVVGLKNLLRELHFIRYVHLWCLHDGVKL